MINDCLSLKKHLFLVIDDVKLELKFHIGIYRDILYFMYLIDFTFYLLYFILAWEPSAVQVT